MANGYRGNQAWKQNDRENRTHEGLCKHPNLELLQRIAAATIMKKENKNCENGTLNISKEGEKSLLYVLSDDKEVSNKGGKIEASKKTKGPGV